MAEMNITPEDLRTVLIAVWTMDPDLLMDAIYDSFPYTELEAAESMSYFMDGEGDHFFTERDFAVLGHLMEGLNREVAGIVADADLGFSDDPPLAVRAAAKYYKNMPPHVEAMLGANPREV